MKFYQIYPPFEGGNINLIVLIWRLQVHYRSSADIKDTDLFNGYSGAKPRGIL